MVLIESLVVFGLQCFIEPSVSLLYSQQPTSDLYHELC